MVLGRGGAGAVAGRAGNQIAKGDVHEASVVEAVKARMLDPGGDLVVHDGALVLADNVDAELDNVLLAQLVRVRVSVLARQALAVDEGAVGRLDVADPNLAHAVGPDLGVLSRQHL